MSADPASNNPQKKEESPLSNSTGSPSISITRQESLYYSSPLPSAAELKAIADVIPNGPERLLTEVEKQSLHRQAMERKLVFSSVFYERLGLIFAFIICLVVIGLATYLGINGQPTLGGGMIAVLVALVLAFIVGRRQKEKAD